MLDWQGHVSAPQYRPPRVVLDDIQDDTAFGSSLTISAAEADHIDTRSNSDAVNDDLTRSDNDHSSLYNALAQSHNASEFMMSVGVTHSTHSKPYLFNNGQLQPEVSLPSKFDDEAWETISSKIEACIASAVANFASGVTPEHLSKVWRISNEEANAP